MVLNENVQTFGAGCQFLINSCSKLVEIAYPHFVAYVSGLQRRRKNRVSYNKKVGLNTVEKLSALEIEELKRYLDTSSGNQKFQLKGLRDPEDSPKPEPTGQPSQVLAAINRSDQMSIEDAEALLQSIKDGKKPMRFDSVFDEWENETGAG